MPGAATDGDYFSPPPLGEWDDMKAAGRNRRISSGPRRLPPQVPIDRLQLKNTTGSQLAIGRVLQVGSSIITTWDPDNLWFNGSSPSPDGTDDFAVALNPVPNNDYDWFQGVGYCLAQVNIVHESHPYADVVSGNTLLQSSWYGRAKIVKKFSTGTGEKQCLVKLGEMFRGPIKVVLDADIAPGASGNASVKWGASGALASPTSTIEILYDHMAGDTDALSGSDATVFWDPDEQAFMIHELECGA